MEIEAFDSMALLRRFTRFINHTVQMKGHNLCPSRIHVNNQNYKSGSPIEKESFDFKRFFSFKFLLTCPGSWTGSWVPLLQPCSAAAKMRFTRFGWCDVKQPPPKRVPIPKTEQARCRPRKLGKTRDEKVAAKKARKL